MRIIETSWRDSTELEQLYQEVKSVQYVDNTRWWEVSQALLLLSNKEKNTRMKVIALQHLGEASFHLNAMEDSIGYIMEGISICENHQFTTIEANLYNLLGVILTKQSNEVQALDYYLKALDCQKGYDNHLMMASIYNNIASLYVSLGDYETSMKCYDIVKDYMDKEFKLRGIDEIYIINEVNYLVNRCLTYTAMKEYSKALSCQWELMKYEDMKEVAYIKQFFHVVNAKIGYNLGEYEQFKFYIRLLLDEQDNVGLKADIFYEYIELFQYLIDSKEYQLASQLLLLIEKDLEESSSDTMLLTYYHVLSKYYQATQQEEALVALYMDYYKLMKRQESMMKETKVISIKTKQRLHRELTEQSQFEKEVRRLKRQSELDALTRLPNRYRLNDESEHVFKKATQNHMLFGILIIDIDYFKEYNDAHGHLEGDSCLCKVAKVIRQCTKGIFSSRFGGDEFFVISIQKGEEELYQVAEEIRDKVLELRMEQPDCVDYRYVTVSQGICVGVPKMGQTYSDFIHSADMALYRGKNTTRNAIYIGNLDFQ